eukprot:m.276241 g.276241  ORF g.276241 m.276241 type:complete len:587 (+) comp122813_c0_seq1:107-1867(+)
MGCGSSSIVPQETVPTESRKQKEQQKQQTEPTDSAFEEVIKSKNDPSLPKIHSNNNEPPLENQIQQGEEQPLLLIQQEQPLTQQQQHPVDIEITQDSGLTFHESDLERYNNVVIQISELEGIEDEQDACEHNYEYLQVAVSNARDDLQDSVHDEDAVGIAANQLSALEIQLKEAATVLEQANAKEATLIQLRQQANDILEAVFNGSFGSAEEQRLELLLDQQKEFTQHIIAAKQAWIGAWKQLANGDSYLSRVRVNSDLLQRQPHPSAVSAIQVDLSESYQNFAKTWSFVPDVRLPYFGGEHMSVLHNMIWNFPRDVNDRAMGDRRRYDLGKRYLIDISTRSRQCQAWVGETLLQKIYGDYEMAVTTMAQLKDQLAAERKNLMTNAILERFPNHHQQQVAEKTGEAEVDVGFTPPSSPTKAITESKTEPLETDTGSDSTAEPAADTDPQAVVQASKTLEQKVTEEISAERDALAAQLAELQSKLQSTEMQLGQHQNQQKEALPTAEQLGILNKGVLFKAIDHKTALEQQLASTRKAQYDAMAQRLRERKGKNKSRRQNSMKVILKQHSELSPSTSPLPPPNLTAVE